jgi:hypothetical protein
LAALLKLTDTVLTYFLPSLELVLGVFCLLEILFMLCAFEKILEYSKPCEVGVSGCVNESVCPRDDKGV